MAIENQTVKWLIVGVLALLLVPVVVMLGMMAFGVAGCCGMMSSMGGMMGGGMTWGFVGLILIAAVLIALMILVIGGDRRSSERDKAA